MKDIGFNAYRFSISWPRILPSESQFQILQLYSPINFFLLDSIELVSEIYVSGGNLKGGVNREGIEYYNNLIDELVSNG